MERAEVDCYSTRKCPPGRTGPEKARGCHETRTETVASEVWCNESERPRRCVSSKNSHTRINKNIGVVNPVSDLISAVSFVHTTYLLTYLPDNWSRGRQTTLIIRRNRRPTTPMTPPVGRGPRTPRGSTLSKVRTLVPGKRGVGVGIQTVGGDRRTVLRWARDRTDSHKWG